MVIVSKIRPFSYVSLADRRGYSRTPFGFVRKVKMSLAGVSRRGQTFVVTLATLYSLLKTWSNAPRSRRSSGMATSSNLADLMFAGPTFICPRWPIMHLCSSTRTARRKARFRISQSSLMTKIESFLKPRNKSSASSAFLSIMAGNTIQYSGKVVQINRQLNQLN